MAGPAPTRIVLIGLRGSGKSTIGRLLAERLEVPFVDLDNVTPRMLGEASVQAAFASHGEAAFRRAEADALRSSLATGGCVLALGGGTPTAPGAGELLAAARAEGTTIVYLRCTVAILRKRLSGADNAHRPSLTGRGVLEEIEAVFAARDPGYRRLATVVLEGDDLAPIDVVIRILRVVASTDRLAQPPSS